MRRALRSRALAALLGATLALGGLAAAIPRVATAADEELKGSREELRETRERIRARAQRMRVQQRGLNALATEIARNEAKVIEASDRIEKLAQAITVLEHEALLLQRKLDERNREAFILGPGAPVLYLLTATSTSEVAARMSILSEMNRRDDVLADKVQRTNERLSRDRAEMARLRMALEFALQNLAKAREELRIKMAESRELFAAMHERQHLILYEISRIHPFAVCPVAGPHAIADGFGVWVHHPKDEGGNHVHQGNDISAPSGTPIVAPFDGVAVASPNKIGGLAVNVFGDFGYVYNAHLSRYGSLGAVEKGDVVGYVGATGNAGGPHDHFEWHPDGGAAVDPYGFLLQVC
jgi:murein DD-endopeptidase MepM/ murein hydrolase activator NlpD